MRLRFATVAVLVISTMSVGLVVGSGPAMAKTKAPKPSLSCQVTGSAQISPGITQTAEIQTLTVTTSLVNCTGTSVPGVTGTATPNTSSTTGTKPENCSSLGKKSKPVTTTGQVAHWNNGDTSTSTYKTQLDVGTATIKGKVTAGDFAKGKITGTLAYQLGAGEECTTASPVNSATITGTFTIS
jgi:hypothetical protein